MTKELLIQMIDGGIEEIITDTESWGGCETCDYGSSYINEFDVRFTTGLFEVRVDNMYDYAMSEGYLMELFIKNIDKIRASTEEEVMQWIENTINDEFCHVDNLTFEFIPKQ